jgi:hypothetical protein
MVAAAEGAIDVPVRGAGRWLRGRPPAGPGLRVAIFDPSFRKTGAFRPIAPVCEPLIFERPGGRRPVRRSRRPCSPAAAGSRTAEARDAGAPPRLVIESTPRRRAAQEVVRAGSRSPGIRPARREVHAEGRAPRRRKNAIRRGPAHARRLAAPAGTAAYERSPRRPRPAARRALALILERESQRARRPPTCPSRRPERACGRAGRAPRPVPVEARAGGRHHAGCGPRASPSARSMSATPRDVASGRRSGPQPGPGRDAWSGADP